ncbi:hypothetical protein JCM10212_000921 [Sporobolomyces blumeae]
MVALFTTSFPFSYPWPAQVYAVVNKYPNPLAPHVVSMDVVDRQVLPDGTIRSERILGIMQDSPRWIRRILGAPDVTYAREVSFIVPSSLPPPPPSSPFPPTSSSSSSTTPPRESTMDPRTALLEPPKLLMASTNLSLSSLLQCRESISYLPHPWPHLPPVTKRQLAPTLSLREDDNDDDDDDDDGGGDSSRGSRPEQGGQEDEAQSHPLTHPSMPPTTLFSQSALIFSLGPIASFAYPPRGISPSSPIRPEAFPPASTFPQRAAGKRVEEYSKGRFEENAGKGRDAMEWAGERFWNLEKDRTKTP